MQSKILILSLSSLVLSCANPKYNTTQNVFVKRAMSSQPAMSSEPIELKYFAHRRQKLLSQIEKNSVVLIPSSREVIRTNDTSYIFRQNSHFYYLTGFNEPDSVALFVNDNAGSKFILFVRPNDPSKEQWSGYRAGLEGAKLQYMADESYDIKDLDKKVFELLANKSKLYYDSGSDKEYDALTESWLMKINSTKEKLSQKSLTMFTVHNLLQEMRLIKDEYEQYLLAKAARISAAAHVRTMRATTTSNYEYELEAEFVHECTKNGATQAYPPIIASGKNATILHYEDNNRSFNKNDLILVDAGAEYNNYTSDLTRTFPASGKFSNEQKNIYELVLKAQLAGIAQIKPGVSSKQITDVVTKVLTQGLVDLGLIQSNGKSIDELIAAKAYFPFYMHGCCHWVGLDVHDPNGVKFGTRTLQPGMVFTIEPGIYIDKKLFVDPKWLNIGVRIEDTILVTQDGYKILTSDAPKEIADIETLMSN